MTKSRVKKEEPQYDDEANRQVTGVLEQLSRVLDSRASEKMPFFAGEKCDSNVFEFLADFDRERRLQGWDEDQTRRILLRQVDTATHLILDVSDDSQEGLTYETMCEQMIQGFGQGRSHISYWSRKFYKKSQKSSESVMEFATRFRKAFEELRKKAPVEERPSSALACRLFRMSLDSRVRNHMELRSAEAEQDQSISQILARAVKAERLLSGSKKISVLKVNAKPTLSCRACGRQGHPTSYCPALSDECYKCGVKGHHARVCKHGDNGGERVFP